MYTTKIPFKDLNGTPRTLPIHFHLFEREVFKLFAEFQTILEWVDSLRATGPRELENEELVTFYNAFEEILLSSAGTPSSDGLRFDKGNRYEFEDSALFNAAMMHFLTDPAEAVKLIDALVPKNLQEVAKKSDENLQELAKSSDDSDLKAEIARLQAQLQEKKEKNDQ